MSQVFIPSRGTNEADFSTADFTVGRNLIVKGNATIDGNQIVDGSLTVIGPINGGGGGGTIVTTTTLDNNTLPASLTSLAVSGAATVGGSNIVTTTTLDNGTLPASFTTLGTSGLATLNTVSVTGASLGVGLNVSQGITAGNLTATNNVIVTGAPLNNAANNAVALGGNISFPAFIQGYTNTGTKGPLQLNPGGQVVNVPGTLSINGSTLTGGNTVALQLPTSSGTIALNPATGTNVTTVTIDNNTLPASFTTLQVSGTSSFPTGAINAGDLIFAKGSLPGTSTAFNSLCIGGDVTNPSFVQAFNASGLPGTMLLNPGGGGVVTGSTITTSGGIAITGVPPAPPSIANIEIGVSSGQSFIQGVSSTGTAASVLINNSGGSVGIGNSLITGSASPTTINMPTSSGTLALNPASGTNVTTVTINNATLPASFTTLATSGTTTMGGVLNIINTGMSTFDGSLQINGGNNLLALILGQNAGNTSLDISAHTSGLAYPLTLNSNGGAINGPNNTLDSGSGVGNATVKGTLSIGTSVLTGGNAVALQLPSSAGILALTSQLPPTNLGTAYFSFSVGSGGGNVTFVAQNSFGTSVITGTGTTTLNFPATTATTFYYVSYVSNATVSNTSTLGSMQNQVIADGIKTGSLAFQVVPATTGTWQLNAATASAVTGYVTIVRTQ